MMKPKFRNRRTKGFTLIEMMMVIVILGIVASIMFPQIELVLTKATQAKTKSNLGIYRTSINLYYSKTEGIYPFPPTNPEYANGTRHSLSEVLVPEYLSKMYPPVIKDGMPIFNLVESSWDDAVNQWMSQDPPLEIMIQEISPRYVVNLNAPFVYNNIDGTLWIPCGNYDFAYNYFYNW